MRFALEAVLGDAGLSVESYPSGNDGLQAFERAAPTPSSPIWRCPRWTACRCSQRRGRKTRACPW